MTAPTDSPWRASVDDLVADVADHARVGVCGFGFTRIPVSQLLALRDRRGLTYVGWGGGLALEILLGAGAVDAAELTFSSLDMFGLAPRFRRAVEVGRLALREWTALGMIRALQARSQHLPFEVMWPLSGTDLGADWSGEVTYPAGEDECQQTAVPALQLDVFLLHASRADDAGNVEIAGARGIDLAAMLAADRVLVTVEQRVRVGELREPHAFVLPKSFVSGVAVAELGAYPTSCLPHYPADLRRLGAIASDPSDEPVPSGRLLADPITRDRLEATARLDDERLHALVAQEVDESMVDGPASRDEIMVCALAHTLDDGAIATIGSASPLPSVAYLLAKLLWVPDLPILSFNGGLVDIGWRPMSLSYAELLDYRSAATHAGGDETYHWYYQQGRITHEVVGTAQIDRRGATNTIAVRRGDGSLVRLPGQGGMADVANLHASFMVYLPRQGARNTVPTVDVRGATRTWHDPDLRRRRGLLPGRMAVMTDLGQFEYDVERDALVLTHVHPGVTLDEVRENTGWELLVADDLRTTALPTTEELRALRQRVDPLGIRRLDFVPAAERGQLIAELLDREEGALDRVLLDHLTHHHESGEITRA
jgi:glutaconate CoA-transferase subunit A